MVPTKTIPQAFSAMFVADPEGTLEDNVEAMTDAVSEVRGGGHAPRLPGRRRLAHPRR